MNQPTSERMSGDIRPIPDPTVLTTAASLRLEEVLRTLIAAEIAHQNDLFQERFARIESQFHMLELRTAEQKKDTKDALDAALAAQKEAVAAQTASSDKSITKSETATSEKIRTLETLIGSSTQALNDKIGDIKDRVIAIEATKFGARESGLDMRSIVTIGISVFLAIVAIAAVVVAITKP